MVSPSINAQTTEVHKSRNTIFLAKGAVTVQESLTLRLEAKAKAVTPGSGLSL
jgi:hypothetical protein